MSADTFSIGWDVGGWNCDNNSKSRDAIVILDTDRNIVGAPWRGNLRASINAVTSGREWLHSLFALCAADLPGDGSSFVLAIDTPLGFSRAFVALLSERRAAESIGDSQSNPYLFRETERHLFRHGLRPLSPVKDMIGSQASKGMHVLARFAPHIMRCGVWSNGADLTAIEAYPSACKTSALVAELRRKYAPLEHKDKEDALTCGLIAWLFAHAPQLLNAPDEGVPPDEGWIWLPRDAYRRGID